MAKRSTRSPRTTPSRTSTRARSGSRGPAPRAAVPTGVPPASASLSYAATCRALLVHAAPAERDDARAQAIAEAAVREVMGDGFRVDALGPGARDYRVSRADGALIDPGQAWTLHARPAGPSRRRRCRAGHRSARPRAAARHAGASARRARPASARLQRRSAAAVREEQPRVEPRAVPGQGSLGADPTDAPGPHQGRGHRRRASRHGLHAARGDLRHAAARPRGRQLRLRAAHARRRRSARAGQSRSRHHDGQRDHEHDGRRRARRSSPGVAPAASIVPLRVTPACRAPRLRSTRGSHSLRDRSRLPRHLDEPRRRHAVWRARARDRLRRRRRRRGAGRRRQRLALGRLSGALRPGDRLCGVQLPARRLEQVGQRRHGGRDGARRVGVGGAPGQGRRSGRRHRRRRLGHVVCGGDDGWRLCVVAGLPRPRRADHALRQGPARVRLQGSADDAGRRHAARLAHRQARRRHPQRREAAARAAAADASGRGAACARLGDASRAERRRPLPAVLPGRRSRTRAEGPGAAARHDRPRAARRAGRPRRRVALPRRDQPGRACPGVEGHWTEEARSTARTARDAARPGRRGCRAKDPEALLSRLA